MPVFPATEIDAIVPLSLLEAMRNVDTPVEDGLEELAGEIVAKRLGLSPTVAAQIARYDWAAGRGAPVSQEEALAVFRLVGRRPDADLVFADAGRRAARRAAREAGVAPRALLGIVPEAAARPLGLGLARRLARRVFAGELTLKDAEATAQVPAPLGIDDVPEGGACGFYGAAFAELLRALAGFEGAMRHIRCRARGDDQCQWRASAVGGYQ
ncbi:MAG TPA: hypothetical protein VFU45_02110 [Gemmatimonadales bacterium]|nr:hypothetical protein [Gemmatimonadales bacterium]